MMGTGTEGGDANYAFWPRGQGPEGIGGAEKGGERGERTQKGEARRAEKEEKSLHPVYTTPTPPGRRRRSC